MKDLGKEQIEKILWEELCTESEPIYGVESAAQIIYNALHDHESVSVEEIKSMLRKLTASHGGPLDLALSEDMDIAARSIQPLTQRQLEQDDILLQEHQSLKEKLKILLAMLGGSHGWTDDEIRHSLGHCDFAEYADVYKLQSSIAAHKAMLKKLWEAHRGPCPQCNVFADHSADCELPKMMED